MKHSFRALRPQTLWLLVGILSPVALLGVYSAAQNTPKHPKPPTASKQFKNIQVLKDLPADQLIPVMHKINASLGVECNFCHVIGTNHTGFEKDDKPTKGMARKMMVMTQSLNKKEKILGGQATCFMCHHGHPEPVTQAPQGEAPRPGGR